MKIVYGIVVHKADDPYISLAEDVFKGFTEAGIPGRHDSHSEVCTKLVSRCRFSKEGCTLARRCQCNVRKPFPPCARTIGTSSNFESSWISINNDYAEKWQGYLVGSCKHHWESSWRGSSRLCRRKDRKKCDLDSLRGYAVFIAKLQVGRPADVLGASLRWCWYCEQKKRIYDITNCIFRRFHPCKRYSWRWHYIPNCRRRLKQK